MFMPAPLNHATGFNHGLLSPLLLGGKAVLQEKFDAESAIDLMNVEGVTWSMGATPFIYDLLGAMERTGKRRRSCASICAAEPPSPERWFTGHGRRASYYVKCTGPPKAARMCTFRPPTRSAGTGSSQDAPSKGSKCAWWTSRPRRTDRHARRRALARTERVRGLPRQS